MLRRLLPALIAVSLTAVAPAGCNRASGTGPAVPQPIRDEKEPGESIDTVSAVPDTSSSSVEEMTESSSETEIEIDEDSSEADGDKDSDKSADTDKSVDEAGDDDEGGEDETGDEPGDLGRDPDSAILP